MLNQWTHCHCCVDIDVHHIRWCGRMAQFAAMDTPDVGPLRTAAVYFQTLALLTMVNVEWPDITQVTFTVAQVASGEAAEIFGVCSRSRTVSLPSCSRHGVHSLY